MKNSKNLFNKSVVGSSHGHKKDTILGQKNSEIEMEVGESNNTLCDGRYGKELLEEVYHASSINNPLSTYSSYIFIQIVSKKS